MTEWSNDRIIEFLEQVEKERVIWDVTHKQHKLTHKKNESWKRISENMNFTVQELKSKKKSLMATFRPLLKKKKESLETAESEEDVFQPIWFAFEVMERFLGGAAVDETIKTEDEVHMRCQEPYSIVSMPTPELKPKEAPSTPKPYCSEVSQLPKIKTPKKRFLDSTGLNLDKVEEKFNESFDILNRILEERREEDECDVYAKLLAKKLRKYPERMRDRITYKIDGLLLDNPYPERPRCSASNSSPIYLAPYSETEYNVPDGE